MALLENKLFLLMVIIIIGELIGKIRVKSFSFGSSAIIFVALVFGHFGYTLPKIFQILGLALFIYSIGIQSGPGFFNSFRSEGLNLTFAAIFLVMTGFIVTVVCSHFMGYSSDMAAGIFAGSLTSTPGLAVAVEMTGGGEAAAAYGVTYTFGVIGVILFVKITPQLIKVNIRREEELIRNDMEADTPEIHHCHLEIKNSNIFGKTLQEIRSATLDAVTITRVITGEQEATLVHSDTVFHEGDKLRVVGTDEALKEAELYLGKRIEEEISFQGDLSVRKILVSKKECVGQSLGSLHFSENMEVKVSRVTRNGIDLPADPKMQLRIGDVVHLVGHEQSFKNVVKVLGNNVKSAYGADVLSILIGITLGFLVGSFPIAVPFLGTLYLGKTGGILLASLILSYKYSTGPIVWALPTPTNNFIRDLGLMLFLATVGTSAGATILETVAEQGISLLLVGMSVTLTPLILGFTFAHRILKIRFLKILGVLTGGMTSTPGLASTTSLSDTPYASSAYACVYPAALIGMIIFTKTMIGVLNFIG